jgi:hypothetical protein
MHLGRSGPMSGPPTDGAARDDTGVFFANGIGDHLMVLPALRALLSVIVRPVTLFAEPYLRHLVFAELGTERDVPIQLSVVDGRNHFDPDVGRTVSGTIGRFISLNPWHSTDVDRLLAYIDPTSSVGMSREFDLWVPPVMHDHAVDRAFRVVTAIDPTLTIDGFTRPPRLSEHAMAAADDLLGTVPDGCRILAVHNETLPHKVWPAPLLAGTVADHLSSHRDSYVVVLDRGGPTRQIAHQLPRVIVPDHLPLDVALAVVSRADLFLGVDSCMLHMADLCRVPGVGLFGPGASEPLGSGEMGFRFGPHRHVHGSGRMDGITAAMALESLEDLVAGSPGPEPV